MRASTVALLAASLFVAPSIVRGAEPAPNVVVFLADDLGWGDLGCYGHPRIKTPNLDKFAAAGVRFTECYSACGVCSPSRSAILTGRTPYRNGVYCWIPGNSGVHLRTSEISLATLLKGKGYDTCHVGKWHLNGKFNSPDQPQPGDHGFNHWMATQNNAAPSHKNPANFVRNGKEVGKLEGFSAPLVAGEAVNWLKNLRDAKKPFYLNVWTHEPHLPIESDPQFMKLYADLDPDFQQHHGNVTQMDHAFGVVMAALEELGVAENTLVIFTADNGPEGNGNSGRTRGSTGGLRGRKRADYEGGIRVPGIVRWPAQFKSSGIKPGSTSDVPVIGTDIFTTVCKAAGVAIPGDRVIDGADLLPALKGLPVTRTQPLYWKTHISPKDCRVAVRAGDWKIVADDTLTKFQLFNLRDDARETADVSAKHADRFEEMKKLLLRHDAAVMAEGPDWWKNEAKKPVEKKTKKKKDAEP